MTCSNRFGEPNVSTTLVAGELNISPGNLYYHYPAKDELINRLYEGYETELLNCCMPAKACTTWKTPGSSCTACSS